jgi:isopentenyl diphosphate isomerase/L-lactate dehydrogenase-like FMN-dependent dehydrogenase
MTRQELSRRRLLKFLVSSPVIAPFIDLATALDMPSSVIDDPGRALNVFDFEAAARNTMPPAHFAYIATGVDDDATLRANREGFGHLGIRVRRLIDVRRVDTSVELFGQTWESPIVLAPAGSQKGFHDEGEQAVARAARARKHLLILSTVSSTSVEEVIAARGGPVWFQLYPTDRPPVARALIKRAEVAGCPVLVLTVDIQGGSNRETLERAVRLDDRDCAACHEGRVLTDAATYVARKPMFKGLDVSGVTTIAPMDMSWDFVRRLRDLTDMPLVLKGIVTREDAALAVEQGVDGLIVSNHGGRGEESGRATIDSLPEVVEGAAGKIPVLVDGGFRRGGDIFKALALGASAVCIGRPYLWGLGAFGQAGVESVLSILRRELETIMRQAGTLGVRDIDRSYLSDHRCR